MKTKYHDPLAGIVCSANRNTWRIAAVLMLSLGSAMPGAASELLPERTAPNTIGYVDQPAASVLATSANVFSGWALSRSGVARVELVVDGRQRLPARLGIAREDVTSVHPDYPDNDKAGFEVIADLGHLPLGHHEVELVGLTRPAPQRCWASGPT